VTADEYYGALIEMSMLGKRSIGDGQHAANFFELSNVVAALPIGRNTGGARC
jgi:hypothetical protein